MTFNTQSNNIEPMFFGVSVMVMVFLSWFSARACSHRCLGKSFALNSMIDSRCCFIFISVFCSVAFLTGFTCWCAIIYIFVGFATFYTVAFSSIFVVRRTVKFVKRFNYLALITGLCYDWFRHLLLLVRSTCLGLSVNTSQVARFIIPHQLSMSSTFNINGGI